MRTGICVVCVLAAIACDDKNKAAPAPSASASASAAAPSAGASAAAPSAGASAAPSASASANPGPPMNGPPSALFVDITAAKPQPIRVNGCDQVVITFVKGKGTALGENLGPWDFMLVFGDGNLEIKGDGTAVVGRVMPKDCTPRTELMKKVVRASAGKDLVWAGGTMRAHFGLEGDAAPVVYAGRLEGTAPVAEHTHPGAWEIIAVWEGAGTFMLEGKPTRVGPKQIILVPPDQKHSWQPFANAKLLAVQMYTPPGPEQRFRKLAADATDGGK